MFKILFTRNCIIVFLLLLVTACQEEKVELLNPNNDNTIPQSSLLAKLMKNVVTHDGSFDDIIDGGNCYSIVLPYTIFVNGVAVIIDEIEDYNSIELSDTIEIDFPVTVTMHNYLDQTITTQEELDRLSINCTNIDDDIECIDFVYPIKFSVFNTNTSVINTVEMLHDENVYNFMEELNEDTVLSMNYPIDLQLHNGQQVIATHNSELQAEILEYIDSCLEND